MTDSDIVKAFKLCITCTDDKCRRCPERELTARIVAVWNGLLDIIERRDAEIESLSNSVRLQAEMLYKAKTEAIKEFAERLKEPFELYTDAEEADALYMVGLIDSLVKEMTKEPK